MNLLFHSKPLTIKYTYPTFSLGVEVLCLTSGRKIHLPPKMGEPAWAATDRGVESFVQRIPTGEDQLRS